MALFADTSKRNLPGNRKGDGKAIVLSRRTRTGAVRLVRPPPLTLATFSGTLSQRPRVQRQYEMAVNQEALSSKPVCRPAVTLGSGGAAIMSPTFTPTVAGTYVFRLVVNDGSAFSAPASVTLTVPILGDINGDGRVDSNDLALIVAALNTPANGPNDIRDLNGDGTINALDTRKLVTLCTS